MVWNIILMVRIPRKKMMNNEVKENHSSNAVLNKNTMNDPINNDNNASTVELTNPDKDKNSKKDNHNVKNDKKVKKSKKLTILQINKGSADFENKDDLIKFTCVENEADIIFISEANFSHNDEAKRASARKTFRGYKIEEIENKTNDKSRVLMIIKNKIPYERVPMEDEVINPAIAIKVTSKTHESTTIVGHYRQWKLPGELPLSSKDNIKAQKERFVKFSDNLDKIRDKTDNLIVIGDINIDQRVENDPLSRPELKALQPILDNIMI